MPYKRLRPKAKILQLTALLPLNRGLVGTVCHELAHVAAGIEAGHGKKFVIVCKHLGLTKGKPTQAMPSTVLDEKLSKLLEAAGPYPHQALSAGKLVEVKVTSLALVCPACDCKATMSVKWINEAGLPTCGCGTEFTFKDLRSKDA